MCIVDACPFLRWRACWIRMTAVRRHFYWMCQMSHWPQWYDDACPFALESFNMNDGSSKTFDWMCAMSDCPQWYDDVCPFTVDSFNMNNGSSETFDWMCAMSDCPQWHDDAACPFTVEDLEMNDGSSKTFHWMCTMSDRSQWLVLLQWRTWRWTTGVRRRLTECVQCLTDHNGLSFYSGGLGDERRESG